ncbi:hypothetical protein Syun_028300 [Stephania yunnanensis]|uniref:Uncharacterized protein n=1 Tax=Stephania yunnanensis TaxID=152371 RepID=A0AAP0HNN4_9MAGN
MTNARAASEVGGPSSPYANLGSASKKGSSKKATDYVLRVKTKKGLTTSQSKRSSSRLRKHAKPPRPPNTADIPIVVTYVEDGFVEEEGEEVEAMSTENDDKFEHSVADNSE